MNPLFFIGREATVRLGPEWTLEVDHATLTTQWRCRLEVTRCRARARIQSRNSFTNTTGKHNSATAARRGKFFFWVCPFSAQELRVEAPGALHDLPLPKPGQHPRGNMLERDKSFRRSKHASQCSQTKIRLNNEDTCLTCVRTLCALCPVGRCSLNSLDGLVQLACGITREMFRSETDRDHLPIRIYMRGLW